MFNKGIALLAVKKLEELTKEGKQWPKITRIDQNYIIINVITIRILKRNKRFTNITIFLTKEGERLLRGQKPLKRKKRYITSYGWSY
jgi:hypothetical protein